MMAVLDAINHGGKLSAVPAAETGAEDRRHLVGCEPPQAEFAAALEQLVDRKVALEDEVAAVLDLRDGIEAGEVDRLALPGGEFRPQQEGPVVETLADDVRGHCNAASGLRSHCWPDSQAHAENQLQWVSFPARDHSASNLALPPVHSQPA